MRLLMTADAVGGVWAYALDLAAGLAAHDIACTIAVCGPAAPPPVPAIAGLRVLDGGPILDWLADDEPAIAAGARHIAALAATDGADLIQLNGASLAALARFPRPIVGVCHSCVGTWWDQLHGTKLPADLQWRADLLARGYAACDRLVAPSQAFADATAARYGRLPVVVRNGRAPAAGDAPRVRLRQALAAGRWWDDGKNIRTLDAAAALLSVPVLAAGALDGPQGQRVALQHATPLGPVPAAALRQLMRRSAVFVSLARYEPFGLAVLEAAQAGCALVLSDIPTFRELWDGAACFVPPGDAGAAAQAIQALIDDPHAASRAGAAARNHALAYGIDRQVAGMAAIYRSLAETGRRLEPVA